ncbi:IS3 family transposase [Streptomyces sp. NPDC004065]|uniref:IS3 family transposase n=1 Tax=Streptomyces sp. NPDC004065 TaxID=3364689 RepID=UPI003850289F
MTARMAGEGFPVKRVVELLGVSESGYYAWRARAAAPPARSLRGMWLAGLVGDIHRASGGRFGYRRVRRELAEVYGAGVGDRTVQRLMNAAGIRGRAGRVPQEGARGAAGGSGGRWVVDVRVVPAVDGRVYAAVVLDAVSGHPVGFDTGYARGEPPGEAAVRHGTGTGAEALWAGVGRRPAPAAGRRAQAPKKELDAALGQALGASVSGRPTCLPDYEG